MPQTTRVFQSGNSQAVRLPKEFRFDVDEVEISREGDAVVLRPHRVLKGRWAALHAAAARGFSEDFMEDGREQSGEQERPALDRAFR
ncbi:antitoxin [Pelagibacterium halotolerans]|uniref:antitoxin n=1 Tax=Pelagibacterium halotolerans TaxID=531813 RepID=UPI00385182C3